MASCREYHLYNRLYYLTTFGIVIIKLNQTKDNEYHMWSHSNE